MSSTRTQVRAAMYSKEPWIGMAATADSIDASGLYVVDVSELDGSASSRLNVDQQSDLILYRPGTSGDDLWKRIASIDSTNARWNIGGSAYTDKTTLAYEVIGVIPDRLNNAISEGQKLQVSRTNLALTTITDFDMATSGVTNWTSSSATLTKDTGAANVVSGLQSLKIAASGAGGYARSATLRKGVQAGYGIRVAIRVRADVGTVTLKLFDVTNSAYFTQTANYSGESFAILMLDTTVPTGCEELQVHIELTGASDVAYVDTGFGPYPQGMTQYLLPSTMDQSYRLRLFRPFKHRISINTTGGGQAWDSFSKYPTGDFEIGLDYDVQIYDRDVNPYTVILFKDLPAGQLVEMIVERDLWQTEPLDSESATTNAPIDTVRDHAIYCFLLDVTEGSGDPRYQQKLAEYRTKIGVRDITRVPQARVKEQFVSHMGGWR